MPDGSMTERLATSRLSYGPYDISLVFAARECAVRNALQSVRSTLRALSIGDIAIGTVEIVLAEAANNIVEHAYADTGLGTISLNCQRLEGLLLFELVDQGKPLPKGVLPEKQHHDLSAELNDLPEGGFGWGLIRDMTTSLVYRRDQGRNVLRFSLPSESD